METELARYVPQGYTDSNTHPLIINGLSGFDMIDILNATKLPQSIPDSNNSPFNDHIDLISAHVIYFEETGFYQKHVWYFIIFPFLSSCLLSYILQKRTL